MSKPESTYKLRKRIKELEREVYLLRDDRTAYRSACDRIFDRVTTCAMNQYVPPLEIIKVLKPLMLRTKIY